MLSAFMSRMAGLDGSTPTTAPVVRRSFATVSWLCRASSQVSLLQSSHHSPLTSRFLPVANYEYIMAFMFNQAGELSYEVRATGILSTQPIDEGLSVDWGTVVHPGVLATHHQHIFSLRVDPMIDGHANRLVYDEAHPMPRSDFNPHGTGYYSKETLVEQSGGYDIDYAANRVFKIQNAGKRNPINGKPVAYKIHAPAFQKMLSDQESFNHKRAEFADKSLYAVKYKDGELYAGGKFSFPSDLAFPSDFASKQSRRRSRRSSRPHIVNSQVHGIANTDTLLAQAATPISREAGPASAPGRIARRTSSTRISWSSCSSASTM